METMTDCQHNAYRWLDCEDCRDKGITCDVLICCDCGETLND